LTAALGELIKRLDFVFEVVGVGVCVCVWEVVAALVGAEGGDEGVEVGKGFQAPEAGEGGVGLLLLLFCGGVFFVDLGGWGGGGGGGGVEGGREGGKWLW
jgi:hypothetical protein